MLVPPNVAVILGNLGSLYIRVKVTNNIARYIFALSDIVFWMLTSIGDRPLSKSLLTSRPLVENTVIDVDVNVGSSKYVFR